MSLKEQIERKAFDTFGPIGENDQETIVVVKLTEVLGLLCEKTRQIQNIMDEDYWTANFHLNKIREQILAVLEEKKE